MADYNYRRSINDFTISLNMHIYVLLCIFVICLLFMHEMYTTLNQYLTKFSL